MSVQKNFVYIKFMFIFAQSCCQNFYKDKTKLIIFKWQRKDVMRFARATI